MGLLCRTKKVRDGISYTILQSGQSEFEVSLSIYNKTYETTKSLLTSVDKWVQQTIEDQTRHHNETY